MRTNPRDFQNTCFYRNFFRITNSFDSVDSAVTNANTCLFWSISLLFLIGFYIFIFFHFIFRNSRVESPEAGIMPNDYSKFPHQRTQSMDSMSSGHSSGDHVLAPISSATEAIKRGRTNKTVVMPLEDLSDQDETPAYLRYLFLLLFTFFPLDKMSTDEWKKKDIR